MFKTILFSLGLLLASLGVTNISHASSLEDALGSSHRLYHEDRFVCSAVAVSKTELLTAAHCVPTDMKQRKVLNIRSYKTDKNDVLSFESLSVSVEKARYDLDTALLKLKDTNKALFNTADISEDFNPSIGTPMFAVGYPRGGELTLTDGIFTSKSWIDDLPGINGEFYKTTIPIMGGSSGGGVFQKIGDEYFLVGLATGTWRDVSFQSYFSMIENVKEVLPKEILTIKYIGKNVND